MLAGRLCKFCFNEARLRSQNFPPYIQRYASSKVLQNLRKRGILQSVFPEEDEYELTELVGSGKQCIYAGFDPTSDSLHIGNLIVIITLLHWQRAGHNTIAVIGGATAQIGDPSGITTQRPILDSKTIEYNTQSIKNCLQRIIDNHQKYFWENDEQNEPLTPFSILDNNSWYKNKDLVTFLGTIGRCFRMGPMLDKTSVKSRLNSEEGMSFAEFSYQVFQAFDWLHLCNTYNCRLQLGGNDQLGNIYAGYDLVNRMNKKKVFGVTVPLVKSEVGDKFGKSAGNAVWLTERTSPFELYQFFYRLPDFDVEKYMKYFTFYSLSEVETVIQKHMKNPERQYAQKKIAEAVVLLVHGEHGLNIAKKATEIFYHNSTESIAQLSSEELKEVFKQASFKELFLEPGITVLDMAMKAKCFSREEDALRIIKDGGLYINQMRITAPTAVLIYGQHILPNGITLVRVGKRNFSLVKWAGLTVM